jgi:hypothetical protein
MAKKSKETSRDRARQERERAKSAEDLAKKKSAATNPEQKKDK